MRYRALAFDYDGTLAKDGRVPASTVAMLDQAGKSGRALLLVTGRELPDLQRVFDRLDLFDVVVAENGGLLHLPGEREDEPLGPPPPKEFVDRLTAAGADPLGVGRVIVATRQPHDTAALEAIRELGLELQLIFNKGAVMVLPPGVNKASGLAAALGRLGLSAHEVLGVGDAENDHAFLAACECSVAVANALPALKERCDVVTAGERGAGVEEILARLLEDDLADVPAPGGPPRHRVLLGHAVDGGGEVSLPPYGVRAVVAGPSGSGKSTVTFAAMERLVAAGYQLCLVDPEGDYEDGIGEASVVVGDAGVPPAVGGVIDVLEQPEQSAVVNLLALPIPDRPAFFEELLGQLATLATRSGRPHWLVVDEAHHLLPRAMESRAVGLLEQVGTLLLITVHPEAVAPGVLAALNTVIAVGGSPADVFHPVAEQTGAEAPEGPDGPLESGHLALWHVGAAGEGRVEVARLEPSTTERQRHKRKYALGTMAPEKSFFFRGPDERLNLRAHNVALFVQLADGVDEATWQHHRAQGDYSTWLGEVIDDQPLAESVRAVERDESLGWEEARQRIRELILDEYTAAAQPDAYGRPDT